jgi:hypothetical protein
MGRLLAGPVRPKCVQFVAQILVVFIFFLFLAAWSCTAPVHPLPFRYIPSADSLQQPWYSPSAGCWIKTCEVPICKTSGWELVAIQQVRSRFSGKVVPPARFRSRSFLSNLSATTAPCSVLFTAKRLIVQEHLYALVQFQGLEFHNLWIQTISATAMGKDLLRVWWIC